MLLRFGVIVFTGIVFVYPDSLKPAQKPDAQVDFTVADTTITGFPFVSVWIFRVGAVNVVKIPVGNAL